MLTQIYEVSRPGEARSISQIGIDHIGILVGKEEFPRELPLQTAAEIAAAVRAPSKISALFLTADISLIEEWARKLQPAILQFRRSARTAWPSRCRYPQAQSARHAPDEKHPGGERGEHRDRSQL